MNDDWKQDPVGSAERGENPTVLARLPSGFAVIGYSQFLPGYCLLLASPSVNHLSDLSFAQRRQFLFDMSVLGEAIERACRPDGLRRINYEILGNTDTYLHAHVFPRYEWEPDDKRFGPVWRYPHEMWSPTSEHAYSDANHGELRQRITEQLALLQQEVGA